MRLLPTLAHVSSPSLSLEVEYAPKLSFVMQQCAVPWLHQLALRNDGEHALRDLRMHIDVGEFVAPGELRLDELQAGERRELEVPDLAMLASAGTRALAVIALVATTANMVGTPQTQP